MICSDVKGIALFCLTFCEGARLEDGASGDSTFTLPHSTKPPSLTADLFCACLFYVSSIVVILKKKAH